MNSLKVASFLLLGLYRALMVAAQLDVSIDEALGIADGLVSNRRSMDTSVILRHNSSCGGFSGGTVVFATPSSLGPEDTYYFLSSRLVLGYQLILDYVNKRRCGIHVGGKNYKIDLLTFDDHSNLRVTEAIAHKLIQTPFSQANTEETKAVDFILSGYSSALTKPLSAIVGNYNTNATNPRLVLAAASALTSNFAGNPYVFGLPPPIAGFIRPAIEGLGTQTDAKTIATVWEDLPLTRAVCGAVPGLVQQFGMEIAVSLFIIFCRRSSPKIS